MNKKKVIALVLGAMLTAGIAFNFATTASYKQNLGTATQTINSATWSVDMDTNGDENDNWKHTIFPGDVIGNDTITLTNENNYPVMFNVKLSTDNTGKLNDALELQLLNGDKATGVVNPDGTVNVLVEGVKDGEESNNVVLTSKVSWASVDAKTDRENAGKSVIYKYDVTAEAMPEIKNVVTVSPNTEDQVQAGKELMSVLNSIEENTVVIINSGTYDVTSTVGTQTGSSFILNKGNIKIIGGKDVIITASTNGGNGINNGINQQNTITINADNVELSGLNVQCIQILNEGSSLSPKAFEVTNKATNFAMNNCTFEPNNKIVGKNANNYGGQVALNTSKESNKDTIKITNCTFNGAVLDLRTAATIKDNTFKANSNIGFSVRFRNQYDGTANNKTYDDILIENNSYTVEPGSAAIGTPMKTIQSKLGSLGFSNVSNTITVDNNKWLNDWISNYSYDVYNKQ